MVFDITEQIFISHSKKDVEIVEYFVDKFNDTGIKPVRMEFELWSRNGKPNWMWIRNEILRSKALFLILTNNIVTKVHTQNWIAFEIGIASTRTPIIPVFVFEEENANFPVPYVSHYFDEAFFNKVHIFRKDFSEAESFSSDHVVRESFIDELIKNPIIGLEEDETIKCSKCLLRFHYWGRKNIFSCPCCSDSLNSDVRSLSGI